MPYGDFGIVEYYNGTHMRQGWQMEEDFKKEAIKQYLRYFGVWFGVIGVLAALCIALSLGKRENLKAPVERVYDYAASGAAGSVKIEAGAAGKVFKIEANVGQAVKKGDAVVIVEAMKMEIPVVAPQDGTVASINVAVGDAVEAGALLATLN